MTQYQTMIDVESALITATQAEDDGKWAAGDVLCAAVASGLWAGKLRDLETWAGVTCGRGWRTMHRRRVAAFVFPAESRYPDGAAWETHARIAEHKLGAERRGEDFDADAWLTAAVDERWTADQVEAAIKAADGNAVRAERVYLLRACECDVVATSDGGTVFALRADRVVDVEPGTRVFVTMAHEVEPVADAGGDDVQVAAQEERVA